MSVRTICIFYPLITLDCPSDSDRLLSEVSTSSRLNPGYYSPDIHYCARQFPEIDFIEPEATEAESLIQSNMNGRRDNSKRNIKTDDVTYFSEQINVPYHDDYAFSWRKLWAFTGPGFLMSIAYLDPGNIESDLQSGTIAQYKLLWLLVWSTVFGLFVQILSARLGIVTGLHMAELCNQKFAKLPRVLLWIMSEVAIIGSDMQEVIGTAIALYLLSDGHIPIWSGVVITIFDTFTFLFIDKYGLRKLEAFFGFLITTMAVTFGYQFVKSSPEVSIVTGIIVPYCRNCKPEALTQAVGIIGAIIMPHNLYLHSALVKSRKVDRTKEPEVREANFYIAIESAIALGVSLLINIMVTSVFAYGLYNKTNLDIHNQCLNSPFNETLKADTFPANNETVTADLYKAGVYLGCALGLPALYIWAIGIFAAGQSSTMTGTYAGQFVMEGFLDIKWARWKRVLMTRSLAIAPTLSLALSVSNLEDLTGMNDKLNVLMMMMLPFALIPLMIFSSSERLMGKFVTSHLTNIFLWILSTAVISINLYYTIRFVDEKLPSVWWVYMLVCLFAILYMSLVFYLVSTYLFTTCNFFSLK